MRRRWYLIFITLWLPLLSGCGSSPASRFYTLTSLGEEKPAEQLAKDERRGIVAVGPVDLADYLDRPQVVRRDGATKVVLMEVDRWAGSLESDVNRVVIENLAVLLGPKGYSVLPWEAASSPDGRVEVSVARLEGAGQNTVELDAFWTLHGKEKGDVLATGRDLIVEPAGGSGGEETTEAMSRALAELSRRIAAGVEARLGEGG